MTCIDCGLELKSAYVLWYGMEKTHFCIPVVRLVTFENNLKDYIPINHEKYDDIMEKFKELTDIFEKKKGALQRKTFPVKISVKKLLIEYEVINYVPTRNEDKVFQWIKQLEDMK